MYNIFVSWNIWIYDSNSTKSISELKTKGKQAWLIHYWNVSSIFSLFNSPDASPNWSHKEFLKIHFTEERWTKESRIWIHTKVIWIYLLVLIQLLCVIVSKSIK